MPTNDLVPAPQPARLTSSRRAIEPVLNSLAMKREWEHSLRLGRALTKEEAKGLHEHVDSWRAIGQAHAAIGFAHGMMTEAIKVFVDTEKELSASYDFTVKTDEECYKETNEQFEQSTQLTAEREYLEQMARAYCAANLHLQTAVKELVSLKRLVGDESKGGRFRLPGKTSEEERSLAAEYHAADDGDETKVSTEQPVEPPVDAQGISKSSEGDGEAKQEPFPSAGTSLDDNSTGKKKKRSLSVSSRMLPAVTAFALRRSSLTPSPLSKSFTDIDGH